MSNRSRNTKLDSISAQRRRQLRRASDRLAVVLQSLDLETEPQIANEVVEAIRATERAYELEAAPDENVDRRADTDGDFPTRAERQSAERQ